MSSRIYFGICPTIPVARNAGQTLNQVQGDKISSLRAVVDRVAIKSTLVLRLAFSCSTRGKRAYVLSALRTPLAHANATARACAKERAGKAGLITLRQNLPTYRGSASGTPRRALDSTQGKPCSVALLGLAFTMAEILLSLTIIGVVAAITLPSLTGNINERTWNTQRKALYARFSQAIALMPALNGYGVLKEESSAGASDAEDTAAETFVTSGLSSVLKINNICDNEHLEDCGIVSKITTIAGSQIDFPTTMGELNSLLVGTHSTATDTFSIIDSKSAAFETQNGESVAVYYNQNCVGDLQNLAWAGSTGYWGQPRVCANFIYDLNGNKGPNTVGKDIGFMTVMYPSDPKITAPVPAISALSGTYAMTGDNTATKSCTAYDSEYRVPNLEELYSMFVNKKLLSDSTTGYHWNSTSVTNGSAVRKLSVHFTTGEVDDLAMTSEMKVWCVRR